MHQFLKFIGFLLLSILFVSMNAKRGFLNEVEVWVLKSQSTLKVEGKTNINSFECAIPSYGKTDTLVYHRNESRTCKIKGDLAIHVNKFDCHHKIMTKDLQKTLKSEIYPVMYVRFKTMDKLLSEIKNGMSLACTADIELAGITNNMQIVFHAKKTGENQVDLLGSKTILFSDFKLKPPSKLGGAIKVKNELVVEFQLKLTKI